MGSGRTSSRLTDCRRVACRRQTSPKRERGRERGRGGGSAAPLRLAHPTSGGSHENSTPKTSRPIGRLPMFFWADGRESKRFRKAVDDRTPLCLNKRDYPSRQSLSR